MVKKIGDSERTTPESIELQKLFNKMVEEKLNMLLWRYLHKV